MGFERRVRDATVIIVHDAARPFVTAALIDRTIAAGAEHGAAIAALPVRDTVKQATGDRHAASRPIAATLSREDIFLAQTPQAFRRDVLARLALAREQGIEATDEAMLAERAGCPSTWSRASLATSRSRPPRSRLGAPTTRWRTRLPTGAADRHGYDLHRLVRGRPSSRAVSAFRSKRAWTGTRMPTSCATR